MASREAKRRNHDPAFESELSDSVVRTTPVRSQSQFGGFTLLEILTALTILAMIMSVVYGSYRAVTDSILTLQPRMAFERKGRFFVQRLSRQLRCCYGGQIDRVSRSDEKHKDEAPDAAETQDMLFSGGQAGKDRVLLAFITSGMDRGRESNPERLEYISYRLDLSRHVLLTREGLYGQVREPRDEDWHVILEDVAGIDFGYFDGSEWHDEWNLAMSEGPPRAVRVELTLKSQDGQTFYCLWVVAVSSQARKGPESGVKEATTQGRDWTSG